MKSCEATVKKNQEVKMGEKKLPDFQNVIIMMMI